MNERMTAEQYRKLVVHDEGKRKNKYGAIRAFRCAKCAVAVLAANSACPVCHGLKILTFDSKAEAHRYDLLRQQEKLGIITDLECQPAFEITVEGEGICRYFADFRYRDETGKSRVEDVKGGKATMTPQSRLKIKLAEATHGIKVEIVR